MSCFVENMQSQKYNSADKSHRKLFIKSEAKTHKEHLQISINNGAIVFNTDPVWSIWYILRLCTTKLVTYV